MFIMNTQYVKNGTLDGWLGFQPDEDYSYLRPGERGSFFKPLEAYALKSQIERDYKKLVAHYDRFEAGAIGRRQEGVNFGAKDPASADLPDLLGRRDEMARRSLVNTYVWNSDGGLYAEEQQASAVFEESLGGSYDFVGKAGIYAGLEMLTGVNFSLDALWGGHIRTRTIKTKQEGLSFGITEKIPAEGFLNRRTTDTPPTGAYPVGYAADNAAGKVNQYRFMSFYLSPSTTNFDELVNIVDPEWLNSSDPDAFAMKQAMANTNEVWRVLHRVTYVNRIAAVGTVANPSQAIAPAVQEPDGDSLAANILLITALPIPPGNPSGALPAIRAELTNTPGLLATLEQNVIWGSVLQQDAVAVTQQILAYMQYRPYAELAMIAVIPATFELTVGESLSLRAIGYYGDGSATDLTGVATWYPESSAATVTASGVVKGVSNGQVPIVASWSGLTGTSMITVKGSLSRSRRSVVGSGVSSSGANRWGSGVR